MHVHIVQPRGTLVYLCGYNEYYETRWFHRQGFQQKNTILCLSASQKSSEVYVTSLGMFRVFRFKVLEQHYNLKRVFKAHNSMEDNSGSCEKSWSLTFLSHKLLFLIFLIFFPPSELKEKLFNSEDSYFV